MNEKDFDNGCFSGNWTEFESEHNFNEKQRKDLSALLLELEDIKRDFKRISEHKERLGNLLRFYNGEMIPANASAFKDNL